MDTSRICSGCFHTIPVTSRICPHCGFDPHEYEVKRIPEALAPKTILRETYLVGKMLGKGGFGITYIGYHLALGTVVAIKELFPAGVVLRNTKSNTASPDNSTVSLASSNMKDLYEKTLRDFMREARTVWEIDLPGVVKVTECFKENGTAYMVMRYIAGKSLKEYLKINGRPMPERKVLRLLWPVIRSMQEVHNKGIMHRDISPDNLMLGEDGKVTLVDFGAARTMMSSMDNGGRSLTVVLKRGYAPIEQYNSRGNQGPWTDVYALCATMYKLLTGLTPDEPSIRLENSSDKDAILGNLHKNGVSYKTCFALLKGMELLARDRFQNMRELEQALYGSNNGADSVKPVVRNNAETFTNRPVQPENMPGNKKNKNKGFIWLIPIMVFAFVFSVTGEFIYNYVEDRKEKRRKSEAQQETIVAAEAQMETIETSEAEVGDIITFGTYEQDNDLSNGSEPIEWLVLDKQGRKALVISKYALDAMAFSTGDSNGTWETSNLRAWLNGEFYKEAFSAGERKQIEKTTVRADDNEAFLIDAGNDTEDKVFLLSISEAKNIFEDDDARICYPTKYALERGARTEEGTGGCSWWLRTPLNAFVTIHIACIDSGGVVDSYGNRRVSKDISVRPALWINLES